MVTTYDNFIEQIAQSVYATMLNIDLNRVDSPMPSDHDLLLASVHLAGQWTGSVVLGVSREFAIESAAAMLHVAGAEITTVDQEDVAAEIVNMIGGNLKSMLPGPSFLSLPTIVVGRDFGLQIHNATLIDDVVLRSGSGYLQVRLYAKVS